MPQGVAFIDLQCYKGEDFVPSFQVDPAWTSDISGWTITCTIKTSDAEGSSELSVSGVVTDGPNRLFTVPFTAEQMTALLVGTTYVYDIWRVDDGFHWMLALGTFGLLSERRVPVP